MLCSPRSKSDVFIYVGEWGSTRLFIISTRWGVWTNKFFQPNNSEIQERYWKQLQHKIIYSKRQHGEIQLGFHLRYENEEQSPPCQGTLHSYDLAAFIATPCQINLCRVRHKDDINHMLFPDSEMSIDSVFPCILLCDPAAETIKHQKTCLKSIVYIRQHAGELCMLNEIPKSNNDHSIYLTKLTFVQWVLSICMPSVYAWTELRFGVSLVRQSLVPAVWRDWSFRKCEES